MSRKNPLAVPVFCGVALLVVIVAILGYRQWTLAAIREDVKVSVIDTNSPGVNLKVLSAEEKAERKKDAEKTYAKMDKRIAEIAEELGAAKSTMPAADYAELEAELQEELDYISMSRKLLNEVFGE